MTIAATTIEPGYSSCIPGFLEIPEGLSYEIGLNSELHVG